MAEIVLVAGCPAAGKTTHVKTYTNRGYERLNRDMAGGTLADLAPKAKAMLAAGRSVVLDNLFPTVASRKTFIDLARQLRVPAKCVLLGTSIEDGMLNACLRMIERKGKVLTPEECAEVRDDPNLFPIAVLYKYRKEFQKPTTAEGFAEVAVVPFDRRWGAEYKNRALILDADGCLRKTKSGAKWPTRPEDVEALPRRKEVLRKFQAAHWPLLGASNQSGIAKKEYTAADAEKCFQQTNRLLGVNIEWAYCPHRVPPITCYCRKPGPAIGAHWIVKYKLNPHACVMVGDMGSDCTFAERCGFQFCDAEEFFNGAYEQYLRA